MNLKKYDTELKWPDIKESWDSLTSGILQLVKGTSIYIIGDSTEINQEVAKELAMAIGYVISRNFILTFSLIWQQILT